MVVNQNLLHVTLCQICQGPFILVEKPWLLVVLFYYVVVLKFIIQPVVSFQFVGAFVPNLIDVDLGFWSSVLSDTLKQQESGSC